MRATGFFAVVALATSLAALPVVQPDSQAIVAIRHSYRQIEHELGSYRKVRHDLMGFSTEGGYLDAWFDGPHVRKLLAMYYGETFRASDEYYFVDDSLVFVFGRYQRYNRPLSGRVVSVDHDRFYFQDGRLIRSPTGADAQARARDLLTTAPLLVACARATTADRTACTGPH